MSEHRESLRDALETASHPNANDTITDRAYMRALVHATAELAEQQRLANLIALARLEVEGGGTDRAVHSHVFTPLSPEGGFGASLSVRRSILDGLGLS